MNTSSKHQLIETNPPLLDKFIDLGLNHYLALSKSIEFILTKDTIKLQEKLFHSKGKINTT